MGLLTALIQRDDAAAVYLNGVEIFRDDNLPGDAAFDAYAGEADEDNLYSIFHAEKSLLRPGINVVAVEVHQGSPTSGDVSFDFAMSAELLEIRKGCDFTFDDRCNLSDIDRMLSSVDGISEGVTATTDTAIFDLDGNGGIDLVDLETWLFDAAKENGFSSAYVTGDANLDGTVDSTDLNIIGVNWQLPTRRWSHGDFDGDGTVTSSDLNSLGISWQSSISRAARIPVPEPPPGLIIQSVAIILGLRFLRPIRC